MKPSKHALLLSLGLINLAAAHADETTGNRYGYPVLYHSEISSAQAWLHASDRKWNKHDDDDDWSDDNGQRPRKPVILDVRRIEEYVAGHPVGSINIPFPHVTKSPTKANDNTSGYIGYDISVDPDVNIQGSVNDGTLNIQSFIDYVEARFPDKDQPLYILCATGFRSVQAANALAKYGNSTPKSEIFGRATPVNISMHIPAACPPRRWLHWT
ncbi:rhodanese-like domain-containing protein [Methylomonas sp. SURF-2]|uniref:Rhodanese-like domain-containing protein n=1 Tax=Methylomonas subterranea TaxID=2952225 RepID=A0ABT1TKE0_9GAMM|nr:rhodanese-like domain-containing protein [Methylomonas sp. SURF-2]MCQ8105774.1 rhodanese-like domain-containing protein [Methylomonas sp. SURF-2]